MVRGSGCSRPGCGISPLGGGGHQSHHRAARTYTGLGKQTHGGHKKYPTSKGKGEAPDGRRAKLHLESNPISARDIPRDQTKPCAYQETPQRLSQTCLWVFPAEVWVSSGLSQGQGLWVQQTWVWHKPSWRRSQLTPPRSDKNTQKNYTKKNIHDPDNHDELPHSIWVQIWKTQQWPQDWKRSVFIPIPKKENAKECWATTQLHSSHMLVKNAQNSSNQASTVCEPWTSSCSSWI